MITAVRVVVYIVDVEVRWRIMKFEILGTCVSENYKHRVEHVASGRAIEFSARKYRDFVQIDETSPPELCKISTKIYCPDVSLVADENLELKIFYG